MKKCLQCNEVFETDENVCPFCQSLEIEEVVEETDVSEDISEEVLEIPEDAEDVENSVVDEFAPVKTKSRAGLYVVLGVLAVAIIALVAYLYFFKVVPSQPVKNLYNAQYEGDMNAYFETIYPPNVSNAKESFYGSYEKDEDYIKELEASIKENFGENYDISVSVLDVENYTADMLTKLKEELEKSDTDKVTDAAYVCVKLKIAGDTKTEINTQTNISVKYDGKWYIYY